MISDLLAGLVALLPVPAAHHFVHLDLDVSSGQSCVGNNFHQVEHFADEHMRGRHFLAGAAFLHPRQHRLPSINAGVDRGEADLPPHFLAALEPPRNVVEDHGDGTADYTAQKRVKSHNQELAETLIVFVCGVCIGAASVLSAIYPRR